MKNLNAIWKFLDGKKTAIGGALMVVGNILGKFAETAVLGGIVSEVGMYLTGAGLAHKTTKVVVKKGQQS